MNAKANSGAALQNSEIVSRLNTLLADYQIHYQNLRGLHWNIQGRSFFTLHSVFEQYYNQAAERIDALAERILMLGGKPLHTYQDYLDTASLSVRRDISQADPAVESVLEDIQALLSAQSDLLRLAGEAGDDVTADLLTGYNAEDEKKVWMLTSYLV